MSLFDCALIASFRCLVTAAWKVLLLWWSSSSSDEILIFLEVLTFWFVVSSFIVIEEEDAARRSGDDVVENVRWIAAVVPLGGGMFHVLVVPRHEDREDDEGMINA